MSILSLFHAPRCCDGPGSVSAGSHAGAWAVKHRGGYPQSSRSRCPLPPHRALAASRSRSQGVPVERGEACEDHRQSLPRFPSIVPVSTPTFSGAPWGAISGEPHGNWAVVPIHRRRALNSRSGRSRFWWRLADSCPHNLMYSACIPASLADPGMCATA